jgi:hypothetical protein
MQQCKKREERKKNGRVNEEEERRKEKEVPRARVPLSSPLPSSLLSTHLP